MIKSAFKASLPAFFGYVALGISFGFIFQKAGAAWYLAPLMSLLVYAGAAQFVAVSLLISHASLMQILSATFFINLRHIFYGISFLGKFPQEFVKKNYMIFGLTDESYSILTSSKQSDNQKFSFYVIFFSHMYWVSGSLIGSILGAYFPVNLSFLQFTLTALFVVLTVEQMYKLKKAMPFAIALISCLIGLGIYPSQMLIISMGLSTGMILLLYYIKKVKHGY